MKNKKSTIKINKLLIFCLLFLFGLIIIRVFLVAYTGIVDGINLKQFAKSRDTYKSTIRANRGSIYDINGEILAQNVNSYNVIAYLDEKRTTDENKPRHVVDKEKTAEELSPILNMEKDAILNLLNKDVYQVELGPGGRNITELIKEKVEKLNLPGIDFIKSDKRYYKMGNFASYVIGYARKNDNDQIIGQMGVEKTFNDVLKGTDGYLEYQRDIFGYQIPNTPSIREEPKNGNDIYLTIDNNIQILLENSLINLYDKSRYTWATFTIADAKTGAIVGSASYPSFDPNTLEGINSYLNPLTQYAYEPGSTMKTFTYMAAMENGVYNGENTFTSGGINIGEDKVTDFNEVGFGVISFDKGFAYSSNVGATLLAQKIGRNNLKEYFNRLGFGKKTGIELPGEANGTLNFKYDIELATASFGQGITTTPIQNIQALTALTNNGIMLKPYIVDKIMDSNGITIEKGKRTEVATVASKETVAKMLDLMKSVVNDGLTSAKYYQTENVTLIGKTGTAQIADPNGGYLKGDTNYIRSFAGIFPYNDPKYIIYISVKQLSGSVSVMANAVKGVVEEVANYKNITETENAMDESKIIKLTTYISKDKEEVTNNLSLLNLIPVIIGDGNKIVDQYPNKNATLVSGNKVFLLTDGQNITLQNMNGWSRSDIKNYCSLTKIKCIFEGKGKASEISYPEGTNIKDIDELKIFLQ